MSNRSFPHDLNAERSVLACMVLDSSLIPEAGELLDPEDFYSATHRELFRLICEMHAREQTVDPSLVASEVLAARDPQLYGGPSYIVGLSCDVPTTINTEGYANVIRQRAVERSLVLELSKVTRGVQSRELDVEAAITRAEEVAREATLRLPGQDAWSVGDDLTHRQESLWIERKEQHESGNKPGLRTGIPGLDPLLGNLCPTDLIVLAARPGMGKSALGIQVAANVALSGQCAVGLLSLEMSEVQIVDRIVGCQARVRVTALREGTFTEDERRAADDVCEQIYNAPLYIDDTPGLTIQQVRARARQLVTKDPRVGLIVVDHLHIMRGPQEELVRLTDISVGLKGVAKDLNVPMLALAQLNRGVEGRSNKRPMLSDLRGCGSLEQDADVVMFIYRDEYYNAESPDKGVAEFICAKWRHGDPSSNRFAWQPENQRFDALYTGAVSDNVRPFKPRELPTEPGFDEFDQDRGGW